MGSFLTEVEGFTPVIDVLAAEVGVTTAAVYGVAWRYCQMADGVCRASQEKIAQHLGIERKAVARHLEKLCIAEYLRDTTPNAIGVPHIYANTGKAKIIGLVSASAGEPIPKQDTHLSQNGIGIDDNLSQNGIPTYPKMVHNDSIKREEEKETKYEKDAISISWKNVLAELKLVLARETFMTYLARTTAVGRENRTFTIRAENELCKTIIINRLQKSVERALQYVTSEKLTLVVICNEELT